MKVELRGERALVVEAANDDEARIVRGLYRTVVALMAFAVNARTWAGSDLAAYFPGEQLLDEIRREQVPELSGAPVGLDDRQPIV